MLEWIKYFFLKGAPHPTVLKHQRQLEAEAAKRRLRDELRRSVPPRPVIPQPAPEYAPAQTGWNSVDAMLAGGVAVGAATVLMSNRREEERRRESAPSPAPVPFPQNTMFEATQDDLPRINLYNDLTIIPSDPAPQCEIRPTDDSPPVTFSCPAPEPAPAPEPYSPAPSPSYDYSPSPSPSYDYSPSPSPSDSYSSSSSSSDW